MSAGVSSRDGARRWREVRDWLPHMKSRFRLTPPEGRGLAQSGERSVEPAPPPYAPGPRSME
jgi:hypothetical protein